MIPRTYYFGCLDDAGHGLHAPGPSFWRNIHPYPADIPWPELDGPLSKHRPTTQSSAALHHKDGWTALAIHDYTVDSRPGSHSIFIFEDTLDFEHTLGAAMEEYPQILIRIVRARPISLCPESVDSEHGGDH